MSGDVLSKVKAGDKLKIPAAAWNACIDAAADFRRRQMSRGAGSAERGSLPSILVRNDTGSNLAQFSVVKLNGVVITEATSHEQFASVPVFKVIAPTDDGCFVAVTQEPIRQDGIGRAMVSGITPVQVAMTSGHTRAGATTVTTKLTSGVTGRCEIVYAEGDSGDQWCLVCLNQSDEVVAVDADNTPSHLADLFADTGTKGADDILVYRDALQGDAPGQKIRLYIKDSHNVDVCDTQVDLAPELRIDETSAGFTLDVRMRKVRLTLTDGVLCLAAGDYGDWSSLCACPEEN